MNDLMKKGYCFYFNCDKTTHQKTGLFATECLISKEDEHSKTVIAAGRAAEDSPNALKALTLALSVEALANE